MQQSRNAYLEMDVLSASPQKLRLMLIDGALRKANQILLCWEEDRLEDAYEALVRCREIVSELLAGVDARQSELNKTVAGVYQFLFRTLTYAQQTRDADKVREVIEVLETERETWRQVCAVVPADDSAGDAPSGDTVGDGEASSNEEPPPLSGGFSIEA